MSLPPRRPVSKPINRSAPIVQIGPFLGIAQGGPARRQRAHALAEELLTRGCMYLQKQIWDEAANEFQKAVQMEANYPEAYNNLGLCRIYQGKFPEAIQALQQAVKLFPEWANGLANLGLALQRAGRLEEAAANYEKSLRINKAQPALWLSLGDCYAALGRLDNAMESYEMVLTFNPKHHLAYSRIGMLQARRNQLEAAETSLRKALELYPDIHEAIAVLGALVARKGNITEACDLFSQVINLEKPPLPAQRGMQRIETARGALEQSFAEWKARMPKVRTLAELYYDAGLAHVAEGKLGAAREAFHKAADANPDWSLPAIWFGFFEALDGNARTASEHWERVLTLEPENGFLAEQLGYQALAMGLDADAEKYFERAASLGRVIPAEHRQQKK